MPDTRMVRLDSGREYSASPEVADAYAALREDAAGKAKEITDLTAKRDALEAERDELKTKLDEALKVDHSDAIAAGVKERMSVEKAARQILTDKQIEKIDEMSNDEIRKAVILSKHDGLDLEGKSPEYVVARFDAIVESIPADKMDAQGAALMGDGKGREQKHKSADQIRKDAIEEQMEASRKALADK